MKTQVDIELEAYGFGKQRMAEAIERNEQKGRADSNPYAQAIYRRFVLPLAERIAGDLAVRKAGRRQAHVVLLDGMDAEAVAFVAVRAAMLQLVTGAGEDITGKAGRAVVSQVGRSVYHEYLLTNFADINPELFYTLTNDLERRMSVNETHRMRVYRSQAERNGISLKEWTSGDVDQVGSYIIECLSQLGLCDIRMTDVKAGGSVRTKLVAGLSLEARKLIAEISSFVIESAPYFKPCIEPPKPWTSVTDGGFHTQEMRRLMPWVVKAHPSLRDHLREADLSRELAAINALQNTAWRINRRMLDAVRNVSRHFDMGEILSQAEQPRPRKPEWLYDGMKKEDMAVWQQAEFTQWKRETANWHTDERLRGTKWGRYYNATRMADEFKEYERLYFVYFMDFRGRKYAQVNGISPQGSDLQKALLEFADGEPLDTKEAQDWFKITGANRWGYDKATLADRVKWVDERSELLIAFATDPVGNDEWTQADKPLQFLAWCMEYADWKLWGENFKSRISVGMDGSCNGLQNFSAMLRDELGGKATNLVPAPLPNDIYQMVADVVTRLLQEMDEDEAGFRSRWLAHGITRKLVKRSVMTLPYGSTRFSSAEFIQSDYLKAGKAPEFDKKEWSKAANFLSHPVWKAIGEVVVKAREAMDWLQRASRTILKGDTDHIMWTTPSGFPVMQVYWQQSVHQIRTRLCGGAVLKLKTDIDEEDLNRHKNGIAPNFVHSLDASHLTLTVNACEAEGITALHMVHDDFGTHARHAQAMYRIIRERFVHMYETCDPLAQFRERYPDLPEPPSLGGLDIRQVLDSPFFFS